MRLRKIRIRNIASLKGEHIVDFDEITAHSSLFAITGETGSGKSTILNSIGLALYGKFFKKTVYSQDVVTLGERDGSVELIFELRSELYLSVWKIKVLKNNGDEIAKPQPDRDFYSINECTFEATRAPAPHPIDEVLSLDFEQFTKCVVLNQGEFAKFLTSSFSDRRSILEKLCPGQTIDNLTTELNRQINRNKETKRDFETTLAALVGEGPLEENIEERFKDSERELELTLKWVNLFEELDKFSTTLLSYQKRSHEYLERVKLTQEEVTKETTLYNEVLVDSGKLQKIKEECESTLREREPRLIELMGVETSIVKESEQLQKAKAREEIEVKSFKELESLQSHCENELKTSSSKKESILTQIKYPWQDLIDHRLELEGIFILQGEISNLATEINNKSEMLETLKSKGLELASELEAITNKLESIPLDIAASLKSHEEKLKEIERVNLQNDETSKAQKLENELAETLSNELSEIETKRAPLIAGLKVQELMTAVSLCILHPSTEEKSECPVCQSPFEKDRLQELKEIAKNFDASKIQEEESKLRDHSTRLQGQIHQVRIKLQKHDDDLVRINQLLEGFSGIDSHALKIKIEELKKMNWEKAELLPKKEKLNTECNNARKEFAVLRNEINLKIQAKEEKEKTLSTLISSLPNNLGYDENDLPRLKSDMSLSVTLNSILSELKNLTTQKENLKTRRSETGSRLEAIGHEISGLTNSISQNKKTITEELQDQKASEVHKKLKTNLETAKNAFEEKEKLKQRKTETLRKLDRDIISYKEQIDECEVHFTKARNDIVSSTKTDLPQLSEELFLLKNKIAQLDIPIQSPTDILLALKSMIEEKRSLLKENSQKLLQTVASLKTKIEEGLRRKDKILLIKKNLTDVETELQRWERLSQILGKDELRTFILSLVEENLIIVTNEELSRLCQGRYEIIHQSKGTTPEFFILDKFRDGGIRKISTLSGGETFMVSLAMALGLAEMTRGTAEIDTLFIDEGFGTLDQESLEDVLDMLNQIQNRGLMVGIISHIKALTSTLPVNLHVKKKQDGTSNLQIVVN